MPRTDEWYVVSDVWMGRDWVVAATAQSAVRKTYEKVRSQHPRGGVTLAQFRAIKVDDAPSGDPMTLVGLLFGPELERSSKGHT
jgi:hypothetical protein